MTLENIFSLIGMAGTLTVLVGSGMFALIRWLVIAERDKLLSTLADHETRVRKVEAETGECVRRSDLDILRRDMEQRFDRVMEQLTQTQLRPARARR